MEFVRFSSPSSLSLSLSFFGPSFPPLLGALFNGVCQVFIIFNGFFFLFFFGLSIKGTTLQRNNSLVGSRLLWTRYPETSVAQVWELGFRVLGFRV
jgi:hypothetical protein